MEKRPDREDDHKVAIRRLDHFSDLAEKRRFARKNWKVALVHTAKKSIEDVDTEIIDKLGIDNTQIRTIYEARLTNDIRRIRDFREVSIGEVGHDVSTLPESERSGAIFAYIRNIDETMSQSFGIELAEDLEYLRNYLMVKLGEHYYMQMLRNELRQ